MNVCVTSLVRSSGESYVPSFEEVGITLFLILVSIIAFKLVVENFQVFPKEESLPEAVVLTKETETKNLIYNE
jgi:hypothetical protein